MKGAANALVCLPLKANSLFAMLLICVGITWHGFSLAFRSLKGLRQREWAGLLSVLYAVPIQVFPVYWSPPRMTPQGLQADFACKPPNT